jgi:hypothetical protein
MELAQAVVERDLVPGEAPEPPHAPEPPELPGDVYQDIDHSIRLWDASSGSEIGLGGMFGAGGPFGAASDPLVVPAGDAPAGVVTETREDLAILSRILRKAAGRTDERAEAMGIVIATLPGLRQPQAMYLGGYGAVFLLNAPFPLAPAEAVEAKPAEKPSNTDWEEARRELYGPRRAPGPAWVPHAGPQREAAYSAERVARLKRELTDALKNASNLRHVKDDEQVVVVVNSTSGPGAGIGHAVSLEREVRLERRVARYGSRSTDAQPVVKEVREERTSGPGTTMVLRVKKADAVAYSAGDLGQDEFARRVGVTTY